MQSITLLPIDIDETQNARFGNDPECVSVMQVYPNYYKKVGFHKPWIGYFATIDGKEIIGAAGYKGKPANGKVEIAYGTFKAYEGKGVGTAICRQLVELSLATDPAIRITARTLPDSYASIGILKKNGFVCLGMVYDEEDGNVLEWEFKKSGANE
jgi:RimJ/RimL family protein N-acetyltransferase